MDGWMDGWIGAAGFGLMGLVERVWGGGKACFVLFCFVFLFFFFRK